MLIRRSDGTIFADARAPIEDFEELVGPILTDEEREADIDTLGGLVMSLTDRVPSRGELVSHPSGVAFEVLDADPRRIKRLRVRLKPVQADEPSK
jgi:CBS domain containing-hemolysin-like protein